MRRALLLALGVLLAGCAAHMPVTIGQSYLLTYDCQPEWMAVMAAGQIGASTVNPCYVEVVRVLKRRGAWIEVAARDGLIWTVNSARVSSFMPIAADPLPLPLQPSVGTPHAHR